MIALADYWTKQLDRVITAMKAGLSRRIELAIAASISGAAVDEAAFLYEIDLDALDATGAAAIDRALAGDLTPSGCFGACMAV